MSWFDTPSPEPVEDDLYIGQDGGFHSRNWERGEAGRQERQQAEREAERAARQDTLLQAPYAALEARLRQLEQRIIELEATVRS